MNELPCNAFRGYMILLLIVKNEKRKYSGKAPAQQSFHPIGMEEDGVYHMLSRHSNFLAFLQRRRCWGPVLVLLTSKERW